MLLLGLVDVKRGLACMERLTVVEVNSWKSGHIAFAAQVVHCDPQNYAVSGGASSLSLLSETVKHRQQNDNFQPTGGDAAFSWMFSVQGLMEKVLHLLTD